MLEVFSLKHAITYIAFSFSSGGYMPYTGELLFDRPVSSAECEQFVSVRIRELYPIKIQCTPLFGKDGQPQKNTKINKAKAAPQKKPIK